MLWPRALFSPFEQQLNEIKSCIEALKSPQDGTTTTLTYSTAAAGVRDSEWPAPAVRTNATVENDRRDVTTHVATDGRTGDAGEATDVVDHSHPQHTTSAPSHRKRYTVDEDGFNMREPRQRRRRQQDVVIGKGSQQRLRVVTAVRRREIFVSRLDEDTTVDEISGHVQAVTGSAALQVNKLKNKFPGYSSHIVCDARHLDALMSEDAWDEGIMVRPFYVSRRNESTNGSR